MSTIDSELIKMIQNFLGNHTSDWTTEEKELVEAHAYAEEKELEAHAYAKSVNPEIVRIELVPKIERLELVLDSPKSPRHKRPKLS